MEHNFYIPIKSFNLGHYFSKACICPAKYLSERNEDIQSLYEDFILLSKKKFTKETNCCLEVYITDSEYAKYVVDLSEDFSLMKIFIPISRVSGIFFYEKDQAGKTIWNIEQGKAFIPQRLVKIDSEYQQVETRSVRSIAVPSNDIDKSNINLIDKYNRLLGGFALMRLGGDSYMDYSLNYFSTLSNINNFIKKEFDSASPQIDVKTNNKLDWLIFDNKSNLSELYNLTYSNLGKIDLENFAKKNKVYLQWKLGKLVFENIDTQSLTFLIAVLVSYSETGSRLSIDNFVSDLVQNNFPPSKKEGISLMFGINKGYEVFRNMYKTENFEAGVKFRLDSIIDYYTIESVYQFVAHNTISDRFTYIESIPHRNIDFTFKSKYKFYNILGCDIIYGQKVVGIRDHLNLLFKRIFFSEISNILLNNFENNIGLKLTQEQKERKIQEFDAQNNKPFNELTENMVYEIGLFHDKVVNELKTEINGLKDERNRFFFTLKELNRALFDDINVDKDGALSSQEVVEYIKRVLKSKSDGSQKPNLKIEIKQESIKSYDSEYVVSELPGSYRPGELFSQDEVKIPETKAEFEVRRKQLTALGITHLRDTASKLGLKSVSRYKNTPEDIELLVKLIITKEQP